jgi:hypothetical protein
MEYTDSAEVDHEGLISKEGRPNFLNKLFEWKDQADLNINREIQRLEQMFLETFGGKRVRGPKRLTSGLYKNTAKTRLLQKAMNLFIDSGEHTDNMPTVLSYKKSLEKRKMTNREKDRLAIINRMLEMTDAEKAWAMTNIKEWYDDMFQYAKDRGIIDTYVEGYVARSWSIPKDTVISGAAETGQTAGSFSNFKLTTAHGKKRSFKSIVSGWMQGTDWNLKNDAILTNLHNYMNEINEVAANKRFIDYMKELVDEDGNGIVEPEGAMSERKFKENGYVELIGKGFAPPFKKVYAKREYAKVLNKVTNTGSAKWDIPFVNAIMAFNAWVKGSVLSLSVFHHFAGVRSWEYGVSKGMKLSPVAAYKRGLDKIQNRTEVETGYELGPIADFMIKHGLTTGRVQDWDQQSLEGSRSIVENLALRGTGKLSAKVLQVKRAARHGREAWTRSLFGRLFAGLKVEAAAMEMVHAISNAEKRNDGKPLTESQLAQEARNVARLINADFGGLHLKRMGRNPNLQKFGQLLLLAPDWTESNFRTVTGALGLNKFINKAITDFPPPPGMKSHYRRFWLGVALRMGAAYAIAGGATMAISDPEDQEKYLDMLKHSFTSWDEFRKARWTLIPIDPWLNRIPGREKTDEWTGFKLGGHFFDVLKILDPDKLISHKTSPLVRTIQTGMTGKDWKGAPIVGVSDWLKGNPQIVSDNPFEHERNFFDRILPTVAYEMRGALPIFAQEALKLAQGESMVSESLRGGGIDIRRMHVPNYKLDEYMEIKSEISKIDRDLKEATTARDSEAYAVAKQARKDYPLGYNRTKSRLGYAQSRIKLINAKIKVLTTKEKLGKDLDEKERQRLKDLEAKKQAVIEKFLEVVKRSKR